MHTVKKAQREIDLIREYRTRLIADVVTGKLDMREAVALLTDERDAPEGLNDVVMGEGNNEDQISDEGMSSLMEVSDE